MLDDTDLWCAGGMVTPSAVTTVLSWAVEHLSSYEAEQSAEQRHTTTRMPEGPLVPTVDDYG
jgi:hypothetical protein